jgi:predicted regulator of amino acid metabolism with ACT domain
LKVNKKATNSEVVEALSKQGITITTNYVSNIKTTHSKRRQVVKRRLPREPLASLKSNWLWLTLGP